MLEVTKINVGLNPEFTMVTVGEKVNLQDGKSCGVTIEVQIPGQSYTLDEIKELARERAYEALQSVLSARSAEPTAPASHLAE